MRHTRKIVVAALVATVVGGAPARAREARPRFGWLTVTSKPWSQVFIKNRAIGTTPLQRHRLATGLYQLLLRTSQGKEWTDVVEIKPGKEKKLHHDFSEASRPPPPSNVGYLIVQTFPKCTVFVDGRKIGQTPVVDHPVAPGRRLVMVKTEDSRSHQRYVQVIKGQTTTMRYRFAKVEKARKLKIGWIIVDSKPDSWVTIDGKRVGETPIDHYEVPAGRHKIQLKTDDGRRKTLYVRVRAGHTRKVVVRFRPRRRR